MTATTKPAPTLYEAAIQAELRRHTQRLNDLIEAKGAFERFQRYAQALQAAGLRLALEFVYVSSLGELRLEFQRSDDQQRAIDMLLALNCVEIACGDRYRRVLRTPGGLLVAVRRPPQGDAA